ncbi:MAG: BMP family lipoprotein [Eubacteriaceae bacterium]
MKKVVVLFLSLILCVGVLAGCSSSGNGGESKDSGYELAMITDVGTIDDKSFNQGTWEGVEKYAKEFGITSKYYKPSEKTTDAYKSSIDLAVQNGAKVVVTPGFLFETAIFDSQTKYPEVKFILIDGVPHNGDYNPVIAENTLSIFYAEEQSGFLAGYAAVKDGYTKLGFMGGMAVPAVVRFGYGFIQGAEYAATEMGLGSNAIDIKYTYVGNFDATPENQTIASAWYNEGTEIIFACGGGVGNSVMAAADTAGKKVIGVDVDQSSESPTVITSAMKMLGKSTYDAIKSYYDGSFKGGISEILGAKDDAVGLPMENSKFTTFNQADYDTIFKKIVTNDGGITDGIKGNEVTEDAGTLSTNQVKVTVVK